MGKFDNRFQFKSFNQRLDDIDIRKCALYHIGHEVDDVSEILETNFSQAVHKWEVLNLTDEYRNFSKVVNNVTTLPQLLHQKQEIIELLLKSISKSTNLALQPFLEILVAISRDLQDEFVPYLQKIFECIFSLFKSKDSDTVEWSLICLAFMFKSLKSILKKNISVVYELILPMLNEDYYTLDITKFALECFAYISRELKDFNVLFDVIVSSCIINKKYVTNCGSLLYEILRGTNNEFHIITEKFLISAMDYLIEQTENEKCIIFLDILSIVSINIAERIDSKCSPIFWKVLVKTVKRVVTSEDYRVLNPIQSIICSVASYKNGIFISEVDDLVTMIILICNSNNENDILIKTAEIASLIILSHQSIFQLNSNRVIKTIINLNNRNIFEYFCEKLINHSQFDLLIFKDVIKYFETYITKDDRPLVLMCKIILGKRTFCENTQDVLEWTSLKIQLNNSTKKYIEKDLVNINFSECTEKCLLFLILLPHLQIENSTVEIFLLNILKFEEQSKLTILLLLQCAAYTNISIPKKQLNSIINKLDYKEVISLKILSFLILNGCQINSDLKVLLSENLLSENSSLRLLSIICLRKISDSEEGIYKLLYEIEVNKSEVQTYRDQIVQLKKIEPQSEYFNSLKTVQEKNDCLRFLLGLLYRNFRLLWDPVKDIIINYSNIFEIEEFWNIFRRVLQNTSQQIQHPKERCEESKNTYCNEMLLEIQNLCSGSFQTVDFVNYRKLLWNCLSKCTKLVEIKNKEVVTFFLNFIENEFNGTTSKPNKYWSIGERNEEGIDTHNDGLISHHKDNMETVLVKLDTFKLLPNPKALYKGDQMLNLFMEFLSSKNPILQKAALDCIVNYKEKCIIPFTSKFYAIINSKNINDELVDFNGDKEFSSMPNDKRKYCFNILLRLLYGRMFSRKSNKSSNYFTNKSSVIRFLGSCNKDEIAVFLNLVFSDYPEILNFNLEDIDLLDKSLNPQAVISAKHLQSTMDLLHILMKEFGNIFADKSFNLFVLKIITYISLVCKNVIKYCEENKYQCTLYKSVKNSSTLCLIHFFNLFLNFEWNEFYTDVVLKTFVCPYIDKLSSDSIHSPTPLLKLILHWMENQNYHKFLIYPNNGSNIFSTIIHLLLNKKASNSIKKEILNYIWKFADHEISSDKEENTGLNMLLPHVHDILLFLKDKTFANKKSKLSLNTTEMRIISLLSNLVTSNEISETLLHILIPVAIQYSNSGKMEELLGIVNTCIKLLNRYNNPVIFLPKIAPLFGSVNDIPSRKLLCEFLNSIAENDYIDTGISNMVGGMNAWDKRWIEQPDYEKRMLTLDTVTEFINTGKVTENLAILFIYNSFYILKNDKDMGLKDKTSETLRSIVMHVLQKYNQKNNTSTLMILENIVLNNIKLNLSSDNNDFLRTELLLLLKMISIHFGNINPILKDFNMLVDNNTDCDFFENITHIQINKHASALVKCFSIIKNENFNLTTLHDYILPICSRYLFKEEYMKKHSVIDAAINTIGLLASKLPWLKYESLLKSYLYKLRGSQLFQKQCVRVVISVLDAFPFDLSINESLDSEVTTKREKIISNVSNNLIRVLNNCITDKGSYDSSHKVNKKNFSVERETEEMQRVPIALAIVKLLQKLPKQFLDSHLSGVLIKLCTFLKSPLKSVRILTRDILKQIMISLGETYLPIIIDYLTSLLKRGFQVHVLSVTIFSILDTMKENFHNKYLESCLHNIIDVCTNDIFGCINSEKEIYKITKHTPEAKPSKKSFLILNILAKSIDQSCLMDMLSPFKEYLSKSHSKKIVIKVQECYQFILMGLLDNAKLSFQNSLIFIYGILSEALSELNKNNKENEFVQKNHKTSVSCLEIGPYPKSRVNALNQKVKNSSQSNIHINIEFALEFLYFLIKRKKFEGYNYTPLLNPFISILKTLLNTDKVKQIIYIFKFWTSLTNNKLILDNMDISYNAIIDKSFEVLHKNATFGSTNQGDNFQLVNTSFKLIVSCLRNASDYSFSSDHISQLLFYVENDINDYQKQPMAFDLMKALIQRKIDIGSNDQLLNIMKKLAEISILSDNQYTRTDSRNIVFSFIMEYDLKLKITHFIKFYITQINFSQEQGRLSALNFINLIIRKFPQNILSKNGEFIYLSLGTRFIIENEPECKILIANNLQLLITNVSKDIKQKLFDINISLLTGNKSNLREVGSMMIIRFVECEKEQFIYKTRKIIPILTTILCQEKSNGKFVRPLNYELSDNSYHEIIQVQICLLKIFEICPIQNIISKYNELLCKFDELLYSCQKMFSSDHLWIRINAIKIMFSILSTFNARQIAEHHSIDENGMKFINNLSYLHENGVESLRSLVLDLCSQMNLDDTTELHNIISRLFLVIANIICEFETISKSNEKLNLNWFFTRITFLVNIEISKSPKIIKIRQQVFNLIDSLVVLIDKDQLIRCSPLFLKLLIRETSMEDQNANEELKRLSTSIIQKIKTKIGSNNLELLQRQTTTKIMQKRAEKRKILVQEKVRNPMAAAIRKFNSAKKKKN